jgi:hypothetical protein
MLFSNEHATATMATLAKQQDQMVGIFKKKRMQEKKHQTTNSENKW